MSDATSHRLHRAVGRPRRGAATRTPAVWREQALAEIASRRAVLERLVRHPDEPLDLKAAGVVRESLDAAQAAAEGDAVHTRRRLSEALRGAAIERTWGQLDAAEEALLQAAPDAYASGSCRGCCVACTPRWTPTTRGA